jgi:hypothetical protein
MTDDREIERAIAALAEDEAPLSPRLRAAILDAAPVAASRRWRLPRGLLWGGPVAAALCGLWLGAVAPSAVLGILPGQGAGDAALLDLALASGWEDWP